MCWKVYDRPEYGIAIFISMIMRGLRAASITFTQAALKMYVDAVLVFMLLLSVAFLIIGVSERASHAASVSRIGEGREWDYFKGAQEPPRKWSHIGFNGSGWQRGQSGFGYGNIRSRTILGNMRGNYKRVYARREFTVGAPSAVIKMSLSVICDGSFRAYLNGIEVSRNIVGLQALDDGAVKARPMQIDISGFAHELLRGVNVISVQCDNNDIDSEDYSFIPSFEVIEK
jgi:hypothetical protein